MAYDSIRGLHQLLRTIGGLESLQAAKTALKAAALHIKGKIAVYPPATEANSPMNVTGRWYERGFGPRWRRKDGSVGGRKTSETLGRRWTTAPKLGGLAQVVGNSTSYGPYVQSAEKQASFHKARGWKTDQDIVDSETERVVEFINREIERSINK